MLKPSDHPEEKLQLEELLRFKRAERPDNAYWSRFDQELHQRMLHALVKKDPFFLQVLHGLIGKRLPAGILATATAVIVMLALVPSTGPISAPAPLSVATSSAQADDAESDLGVTSFDYAINAISVGNEDFQRDFGMDRVEAPEFTQADYSVQEATARTGGAMLASLTF